MEKQISNISIFKDGALGIPLGATDLIDGMWVLVNNFGGYRRMEVSMHEGTPIASNDHDVAILGWDDELEQWICDTIVNKKVLKYL